MMIIKETVWTWGTPFQNWRHLYGIWATLFLLYFLCDLSSNGVHFLMKCVFQYFLETKSIQFKSNVGFRGEGKTGVPGEKPLGAE